MKRAIAFGIMVAAAATAGCSEARSESGGPTVDRDYQVGSFDRISVAGSYDTTVRTGAAPSVHVRGDQKEIDNLEVKVEAEILRAFRAHGSPRQQTADRGAGTGVLGADRVLEQVEAVAGGR